MLFVRLICDFVTFLFPHVIFFINRFPDVLLNYFHPIIKM